MTYCVSMSIIIYLQSINQSIMKLVRRVSCLVQFYALVVELQTQYRRTNDVTTKNAGNFIYMCLARKSTTERDESSAGS